MPMLSYVKAIEKLLEKTLTLKKETISLDDACGRVACEDLIAGVNQPQFRNSSMDGFAICAKDDSHNGPYEIIGTKVAGDKPGSIGDYQGKAFEVMTGAPIPEPFDTIVPVENVEIINKNDKRHLKLTHSFQPYQFVRDVGIDFCKGDLILAKGQTICPKHIAAIALFGQAKVPVYKKLKVAIFFTGKEVIDNLESPLKPGQIYNVTGTYLKSILPKLGIDIVKHDLCGDDPVLFKQQVQQCLETDSVDMIFSTGAVSRGILDFVPKTINALNGKKIFHRIAIHPGKPVFCAIFPDNTLFFGLPGNIISSMVSFRFVALPFIMNAWGQTKETTTMAKLKEPYTKSSPLKSFLKAEVALDAQGIATVSIVNNQASFMLSPMLHTNCWLALAEGTRVYQKDELLAIYPLWPTTIGGNVL